MKSCISGSHGFIGTHLTEKLTQIGHVVVPITQELLYTPQALADFFELEQPDYIFHLAAYGNMSEQKEVVKTVMANYIGTYNMLDASCGIDYKKFINFSTSSVLLPTETFYSATKAGAERLSNAFRQQLHKPIITIRPFSIYGENEADFRFIPTLIWCLLSEESMSIDLLPTHDWVYVKEFIDKLLKVIETDRDIVNMGTGISYSNLEVKNMLEEISGKKLNYATVSHLRSYDTTKWVSPQKTIKSDLKEGLTKTYEWYKKRYEKQR